MVVGGEKSGGSWWRGVVVVGIERSGGSWCGEEWW